MDTLNLDAFESGISIIWPNHHCAIRLKAIKNEQKFYMWFFMAHWRALPNHPKQ